MLEGGINGLGEGEELGALVKAVPGAGPKSPRWPAVPPPPLPPPAPRDTGGLERRPGPLFNAEAGGLAHGLMEVVLELLVIGAVVRGNIDKGGGPRLNKGRGAAWGRSNRDLMLPVDGV